MVMCAAARRSCHPCASLHNLQCKLQVEVKLRLADKEAHDKLVTLLAQDQTHLYRQENLFYDGSNRELSSQRTVLRVRWFNDDEKVVITVKGKMAVVDGVGRAEEHEDEVEVATAKGFAADPNSILAVDAPVIHTLKECAAPARAHACLQCRRSTAPELAGRVTATATQHGRPAVAYG